jgi:integrase
MASEYPEGRPGYGEVKPRIIERKDGSTYQVYIGCYKGPEGNRNFVSDKKKKQAQDLLRVAMNEVEAGTRAKDGNITLKRVLEEYVDDLFLREKRGDITYGYSRNVRSRLKALSERFVARKLSEFKDSGLIREEMNRLRATRKVRTVGMVRDAISRAIDFAIASPRRYVPRNIMKDDPVKLPKPARLNNAITEDDAIRLLEAAANRQGNVYKNYRNGINFYAILCLMLDTGARPEEACGLRFSDLTLFDGPHPECPSWWGVVTYRRRHTFDDGFLDGLKEGSAERTAAIGKRTVDAINSVLLYWQAMKADVSSKTQYRWLDEFIKSNTQAVVPGEGLVFVNKHGKPYHCQSLGKTMRKVCAKAELWKQDSQGRILMDENGNRQSKYSLYSLRKLVTNDNVRRLPHTIAASVTGHTTQTLLQHYTQYRDDDLLESARVTGQRAQRMQITHATDLQQEPINRRK